MKVIAFNTKTNKLSLQDKPEPTIQADDEVKLKVLEVGICGTDREAIRVHGRAHPPQGETELILGHEMIGEVVEVGKKVTHFKKGDLGIVTVRRGCDKCYSCQNKRYDMCSSGDYLERGIKGLHGFMAEYVVDQEKNVVKAPLSLRVYGVLTEPLSVVEKALDELLNVQKARLPDWHDASMYKTKRALVAGLGPIGLLACIVLRLRNFQVVGVDRVEPNSPRAKIVEEIGGTYIDSRKTPLKEIPEQFGQIDLIFEAAGTARLEFELFDLLAINGCYVLTGVPHNEHIEINGGHLVQNFVLKNQIALGSVNASKKHWEMAVKDLNEASLKWNKALGALLTSQVSFEKFPTTDLRANKEGIKSVITWSTSGEKYAI